MLTVCSGICSLWLSLLFGIPLSARLFCSLLLSNLLFLALGILRPAYHCLSISDLLLPLGSRLSSLPNISATFESSLICLLKNLHVSQKCLLQNVVKARSLFYNTLYHAIYFLQSSLCVILTFYYSCLAVSELSWANPVTCTSPLLLYLSVQFLKPK